MHGSFYRSSARLFERVRWLRDEHTYILDLGSRKQATAKEQVVQLVSQESGDLDSYRAPIHSINQSIK